MPRLITVIIISLMLCISCFSGCSKKSEPPPAEEAKTMQEYQAEAKEQIDEKNAEKELEALEKEVEQDIEQEQ